MALVSQPAILSGAFAAGGDKNTIPATNDGLSGLASIEKGFPPICQQPLAQGGLPPQRADFNGIFNLFSQFLLYLQNGGVFAYNNGLDYQPPCLVADPDSNIIYQCLQQNGPNTSAGVQALTQDAYWQAIVLPTDSVVSNVTESNGTVTVDKADGSSVTFNIATSVNGISVSNGNVDINRKFFNSLPQAGFDYATVTPDLLGENLPANSTLTFYASSASSSGNYAPNLGIVGSYMIIVRKGASATVPVSFEAIALDASTKKLIGNYTNGSSYGFSGWSEVVNIKTKGINYIQFSDGSLYQTGTITVTNITSGSSQNQTVTFPLPFNNTNYKVWFSVTDADINWGNIAVRTSSQNTTNMTLNIVNFGGYTVNSVTFNWFAEVI